MDQQCDRPRRPGPRDFRSVLRGRWPRPPRRALIPYLSGDAVILASGCPSPPSAGHELFFHFYTGTNRNDKTLCDEGRTGIDKPWKTLFPQITGGLSTQSPGRKVGGGPGESPAARLLGRGAPVTSALPGPGLPLGGSAVDVEQLPPRPLGRRARGTDGLASSPHGRVLTLTAPETEPAASFPQHSPFLWKGRDVAVPCREALGAELRCWPPALPQSLMPAT